LGELWFEQFCRKVRKSPPRKRPGSTPIKDKNTRRFFSYKFSYHFTHLLESLKNNTSIGENRCQTNTKANEYEK
jgi:hypothetical protein